MKHSLLPDEAQRILKESSQKAKTLSGIRRKRVIQEAIARVQSEYPQYFTTEKKRS